MQLPHLGFARRCGVWLPCLVWLSLVLAGSFTFANPQSGTAQPAFRVTLLGTGYPEPRMDRFGPSILVQAGDSYFLFDCGRGATQRLAQIKAPPAGVNALFLTHLHSDHTVGIPDLWLTGWVQGRNVPLRVWGPSGTKSMMTHLQEAYAFDVHIRRDVDERLPAQGVEVVAQDIGEGVVYQSGGVKITAFSVDHGPVKPALGYRVDFAGHSIVLSGDTRPSDNLVRFAQGADVLIHEVMDTDAFRSANTFTEERVQRVAAHHTTPEAAGRIFSRVKPRLAVYSHIVPGSAPNLVPATRKTYSGPLEVGEDLMTIGIGGKIDVHRPPGGANAL